MAVSYTCFTALSIAHLIPLTPCGPGFGLSHHQSRLDLITKEFKEKVTGNVRFTSFNCKGFQDLTLDTELILDKKAAESLVYGIEEAYFKNDDKQKEKRKHLFSGVEYGNAYKAKIDIFRALISG